MYPDFYPIFQVLNASLVKEQSVYTELCHWNQTIILNVELQIISGFVNLFVHGHWVQTLQDRVERRNSRWKGKYFKPSLPFICFMI